MNNKKYIPFATWLVISGSLILTVYVKLKQDIDPFVMIRMSLAGVFAYVYAFALNHYGFSKASLLFLVISVLSGFHLYVNMPTESIGFQDLSILLSWLVMLGLGVIISLIYAIYLYYKRKK